jgi:hypothetical protein
MMLVPEAGFERFGELSLQVTYRKGRPFALLYALLRDRRSQHVAQQRLAPRRVESARPRRRVQREPIERRAQRLLVGQGLRLEGGEAAHPLGPGRRATRWKAGQAIRVYAVDL